jgi:hypothetical protein
MNRKRPIRDLTLEVLRVISDLERRGCRIVGAASTPAPCVRINPPPPGVFDAWGFIQPPPRSAPGPVECIGYINGVRVAWWSGGVRHG